MGKLNEWTDSETFSCETYVSVPMRESVNTFWAGWIRRMVKVTVSRIEATKFVVILLSLLTI